MVKKQTSEYLFQLWEAYRVNDIQTKHALIEGHEDEATTRLKRGIELTEALGVAFIYETRMNEATLREDYNSAAKFRNKVKRIVRSTIKDSQLARA